MEMNLKSGLAGVALSAMTLGACNNSSQVKTEEQINARQREIADTMQDQKQPVEADSIYRIPMRRVQKGPLGIMKGLSHGLSTLLGGKYADSIIPMYNGEIVEALADKKGHYQWTTYDEIVGKGIEEIKAPLVYPTLKSFFNESLDEFLANRDSLRKQIGEDKEVIIITRNSEVKEKKDGVLDTVRKNVIGYYVDGELRAAQYMSAGQGRNIWEYDHRLEKYRWVHAYTKTGVFHTNQIIERGDYGDGRDSDYVSGTFGAGKKGSGIGAPMPYAIPINDEDTSNSGVFLHTGYADGEPRSHECNRLPGWFSMYMYDHIGDRKVKTVVYDMYDKIIPKPKGGPKGKSAAGAKEHPALRKKAKKKQS